MPTPDGEEYSFKFVNGHPSNPARGFQTVTAFGVLADVDNGYPTFLAEMTLLTALRTAATSAMVARHLARKDASKLAMIGAGSQAEFQALGFRITLAESTDDAVADADIITTCTADKAQNQILASRQVKPGVHLNAVGGDCPGKTELDAEILERGKVFVEFPEQTRIEGEIQQMPDDFEVTEFWKVLTNKAEGRTSDEDITIFDSVGFAINDFSALRCCRDATAGSPLQASLDLVADPDDPKDLFSLTKVPAAL